MSAQDGQRLAKALAAQLGCSRREAELYIEAGQVLVDGVVVDQPQARVRAETLSLQPGARPDPLPPVTLLLHKPSGHATWAGPGQLPMAHALLVPAAHWPQDPAPQAWRSRHGNRQQCLTPLETAASGLVVYSQDARVQRKLLEDAAWIEHELLVTLAGQVPVERWQPMAAASGSAVKLSLNRQTPEGTVLRWAGKGYAPGAIAAACEAVGLQLIGLRRLRIGRQALGPLPAGQWRYAMLHERI